MCAIVPAYPKELTPIFGSDFVLNCVDSTQGAAPQTAEDRCGLSARRCALGDAACICEIKLSVPASPAPGSVCPAFAFRLPTVSGWLLVAR
eukprot:2004372-Prymnesium_polylepis.1